MSQTKYQDFLATKLASAPACGLESVPELNPALFPFQRDIVKWALRRGRAAIFAECGMGKTLMQLEWSNRVPGRVLILTPLAVAPQTVAEAARFGIDGVKYLRAPGDARITVTNYEILDRFDPADFVGVVLDESSILKSYDGSTRTAIIEAFEDTPFKLACTATPAPNDHMELGNHAEFLGVLSRVEMLATYFVHDGGETQKWRLKGHAQSDFWRFVASWAAMIRKPSDLGYEDGGFNLPPLRLHEHRVAAPPADGHLFALEAASLQERIAARRSSVADRVEKCAEVVKSSADQWIIWCNLNSEADAIEKLIPGSVQVQGSDSREFKETAARDFQQGKVRVLVSKVSIFGFGLNLQNCHNIAFVGLSDSWEQYYQAVRRCWRFGQGEPVDCHVIVAETEGAVLSNIKRKEADAERMAAGMMEHMKDEIAANLKGQTHRGRTEVAEDAEGEGWRVVLGDCIEVLRKEADGSVDFSIFSPPFASLYTYSASEADMGNVRDHEQFFAHFGFLVPELLRVTKPGRLCSFHCMNLPTSKTKDGVIGIRDFRGELIRAFEAAGWIYHSEVCIWKDPVTAMQRTKALGLLHKQIKKDSCMSRQGIADYLVTMRKPGDNPSRVTHTNETFPVSLWQKIASPVWMDINPSDTLQYRSAREHNDERHIAPLQLEVIRRALMLWSNPGDLVLSPFSGIGSEGFVAIEEGRRFLGCELKRSYWEQSVKNLSAAHRKQSNLFTAERVSP